VSQPDATKAKAHADISALWNEVSAKLDTLSSEHYKPKPATPDVRIRVEAPAITLEDAQPTFSPAMSLAETLAPQEIYAPGIASTLSGETLTKTGLPVAHGELSRDEKLRQRRRAKDRRTKHQLSQVKAQQPDAKAEVVRALRKGNEGVIGKGGMVTGIDGEKLEKSHISGSALKP
jgi:U3 small nucleolar RNA-associated protein MPP10